MRRVLVSFAIVAALAAAGWYVRDSSAESQPSISLSSATVEKGGTATVVLKADKMPDPGLNVWVIDIDYMPGELSVVECTTLVAPVFVSCMDFGQNVRFTGSGTDGGITGNVNIGSITFQAGQQNGTSVLRVVLHTLADADGTDLLPGALSTDGSITITGVAPTATEPLPGFDDTPTPTATPTGPTPTATVTPTPPQPGSITVRVSQPPNTPFKIWEVNLFEGEGCLGTAIDGSPVPVIFFDIVIGQPYSVSLKLQGDWVIDGGFCQNVTLTDSPQTLRFRVILIDGDVNKDGRTNSLDALLVIQHVARLLPQLPNALRADVNQNGEVDILDAQLMFQFEAGLLDSLPVGGG